jgi:hypothetical protein
MGRVIGLVAGVVTAFLIFFKFDPWLVSQIMDMIQPPQDWFGTIKFVVWCIILFFSFGITIGISALVGSIIGSIFSGE